MALKTKLAAATTLAAAFSMLAATPADARERWGRWHRDRVDAGDVLTGVLILGGIAAIASAAGRADREERYPEPYPNERPRYQPRGVYQPNAGRGMDRAAQICADEVERRSGPVGSVDGVNRNRDGWQVTGRLENGQAYSCWIGNDGRISDVDVSEGVAYDDPADGQWSDDAYLRARQAQDAAPAPDNAEDDGRYTLSQAPDFRE